MPQIADNLSQRLAKFRSSRGLSQQELGNLVGVGKITILRWENGSSKPSPLAARRLQAIGFGEILANETKLVSQPRFFANGCKDDFINAINREKVQSDERPDVRLHYEVRIGAKRYQCRPSPYVVNGPPDQLQFFEQLYELQQTPEPPCDIREYVKRLSCVASVPELREHTSQGLLEHPKSSAIHWDPNYGLHGIHRYVGRFPPHLIRAVLNHFRAKRGELVCDPFAGSGTTLLEARLLGLGALGIEICPLSVLISKTKSQFPSTTASLERTAAGLRQFYEQRWSEVVRRRDAQKLSHEDIVGEMKPFITPFPNLEKWLIPEALLGCSIVVEYAQQLSGYEKAAVCCALSARMRSIGNVDVDVVRAEYSRRPRERVDVLGHVERSLHRLIVGIRETVVSHQRLIAPRDSVKVIKGSLLATSIPPNSVDYIVTSPPYGVESLSYLRTHLLSYRCLNAILKHDPYEVSDQFIGSEYSGNGKDIAPDWRAGEASRTFRRFFQNIWSTDKKLMARSTMMMKFFAEMVRVADQLHRWVRPEGRIAFVIGNKKIGEQMIPTDVIIREIFESRGLFFKRALKHKLKCNNSNSEVPWQERIIQDEYVLLFSKAK